MATDFPPIPPKMDDMLNRFRRTRLNWCIAYYTILVLSIVTPAVAGVLAFWKDTYPWAVAIFAALGIIWSGVLDKLEPKTEWMNFRNAYVYFFNHVNRYQAGKIDLPRLAAALEEAQRYLGPIPPPPPPPLAFQTATTPTATTPTATTQSPLPIAET